MHDADDICETMLKLHNLSCYTESVIIREVFGILSFRTEHDVVGPNARQGVSSVEEANKRISPRDASLSWTSMLENGDKRHPCADIPTTMGTTETK